MIGPHHHLNEPKIIVGKRVGEMQKSKELGAQSLFMVAIIVLAIIYIIKEFILPFYFAKKVIAKSPQ